MSTDPYQVHVIANSELVFWCDVVIIVQGVTLGKH